MSKLSISSEKNSLNLAGEMGGYQSFIDVEDSGPLDGSLNKWISPLFKCGRDEEISNECVFCIFDEILRYMFLLGWWGCWCSCLVADRTDVMFQQKLRICHLITLISLITGTILFTLLFGYIIGTIVFCVGYLGLSLIRAYLRGKIRRLQGIPGSDINDFLLHLLFPCLAICQESRQSIASKLSVSDFITGEDILQRHAIYELVENAEASLNNSSWKLFRTHLAAVSWLSKIILIVLCLLVFIAMVSIQLVEFILCFVLVLQPIILLYFLYWRRRRRSASLDYVIKAFATGMFATTVQALVVEYTLQWILAAIMTPYLGPAVDTPVTISSRHLLVKTGQSRAVLREALVGAVSHLWNLYASSEASVDHTSIVRDAGGMVDPALHLLSSRLLATTPTTADDDVVTSDLRVSLTKNMFAAVLCLLVMSFVVAAGVEETFKHYIVRGCRYPAPLKDASTLLVYMLAGALGFALIENLEYVLGTTAAGAATSVLEAKLTVLVFRTMMPIHMVCAALQAAYLAKVR